MDLIGEEDEAGNPALHLDAHEDVRRANGVQHTATAYVPMTNRRDSEPTDARPRRRLPGWLMPVLRVVVTVALMAMVLSGIKWEAFLKLLLLEPHGVLPERAVAIGLLWLACTILSGLIGGVLFMLDRKQADTGRSPTDQAT